MNELEKALKVNKRVSIEHIDENGKKEKYASRIENIGPDWICLATPMSRRLPVYLPPQTEISVFFWDSTAVYSFSTLVLKNIKEGSVGQLAIKYPDKFRKVQNREFVRVPASLNVTIKYLNKDGEESNVTGKTRDISGGGMMVIFKKPGLIKKDTLVTMEFKLNDASITSSAVIVREDIEIDPDGITRAVLGIKFLSIPDKDRQVIIKFVFDRQIELRRKGLL